MSKAVADESEHADRRGSFERRRRELFAQRGFEAEGRWIGDRERRRTYVLSRGESDCPTVLIHGGLSHAGEWVPLAGRMPGHVVIPDRPGCGLSYPIDYRRLSFRESAASWLLELLDAIGADEVDLVGNSMGGFFSIALALARPERVRRIVFVGAPAGLDRAVPFFLRLWGNPIAGALIRRLKITDPEVLRKRVYGPLLVAHPEDLPLELLELDIANAALPGVEQSAYGLLRAATTLRGFRKELLLRNELAGLKIPSLFLWGESDRFAPPSSGEDIAGRMPSATIEVLPDTGHLPHVERPETVAAAVLGFLGRA